MEEEKIKTKNVAINENLHKALKKIAIERDDTLQHLVEAAVRDNYRLDENGNQTSTLLSSKMPDKVASV
jgi:hypothetical protein